MGLDWSSGLKSIKCTGRINIALNGSFADMVLLSSDYHAAGTGNMIFVLTNSGQLDLYDNNCLSSLMSKQEKKTSSPTLQYPMVIPTLEPYMTTATLAVIDHDVKTFRDLSQVNAYSVGPKICSFFINSCHAYVNCYIDVMFSLQMLITYFEDKAALLSVLIVRDICVGSCSCKAAFSTKSDKYGHKVAFDRWCSRSAFQRRRSYHSNIYSRIPRWICSDMGCHISGFVTSLQHKM